MKNAAVRCQLQKFLCAATAVLLAGGAFAVAAQRNSSASIFTQDKGKLTIQLEGKVVGHEDFEIQPSGSGWTAKGTTEIKPPKGPSSKISGTLSLQADGAPISYEWKSEAEKTNGAHISFANGVAKMTLEMQGARPCTAAEIADAHRTQPCFFEQNLSFNSPLIAVLDNNLYHQYAVLARVYDWSKRGSQTFSVIIPQELTPGSITVEATGTATSGGKSYEGLKVTTSDLEVLLFLDPGHKLMRLEVPAANVSVIRE